MLMRRHCRYCTASTIWRCAATHAPTTSTQPCALHQVADTLGLSRSQHSHTTAHKVAAAARDLHLSAHLKLVESDAYALAAEATDADYELIWLDFGIGVGG